jgi:hypothetical protein
MFRTDTRASRYEPRAIRSVDQLRELADKIFNQADWVVVTQEVASVQELFIRERRSLAFQWLLYVRQRATGGIYCYLIESHRDRHPRVAVGLKMVSQYTLFLSLYVVLFLVIRWGNPVFAATMANWAVTVMERFSQDLPASTARLH